MVEFSEVLFFFFSSRRRHTRLQGDWSSDVCSSDLVEPRHGLHQGDGGMRPLLRGHAGRAPTQGRVLGAPPRGGHARRSEEHTSELQSPCNLVCRLLLEKKNIRVERSLAIRSPHYSG